jgi:protein O-mannosyl-transferase
MGNSIKKTNKPVKKPVRANRPMVSGIEARNKFWLKCGLLSCIFIITFWCYHYSIKNEFTNWDDDRYIPKNIFIKSFSSANVKMMLFHDVKVDNYMPLTVISYALNYHFSGLAPQAYYLVNILVHILNSFLVFFIVIMILKAMEKQGYGVFKWKEWLAFFCTLVFAVHPMHVESVSWIAERKDVLYFFFYFAGMITYVQFSEAKTKRLLWLFAVFIFYLLSLLAKPMALVFPFSLLTIDLLLKRDQRTSIRTIIVEKLPFITVSVIAAIATYHLQKSEGALGSSSFKLFQRILFACNSFNMYILKAIIPLFQSSFYPYPDSKYSFENLPFIFYLSPLITLSVVAIPLYFSYLSGKNNFRIMLFGLGFYLVNMIIVSQMVGVGPTILADRYTYVCYFGIFFPATIFIYKIIEKSELIRKIAILISSVYLLFFAYRCYERTLVWHNSETLWTDAIEEYPNRISMAYVNLGLYYYFNHRGFDLVYDNYLEALKLDSYDPKVYCDLGLLMWDKNLHDSAIDCFTEAIKVDSNYAPAYMERGTGYAKMGKYNLAIQDYWHSSRLNPYSEALLENIAYTWLKAGQFDSSIIYYNRLIRINPSLYGYYHCRGIAKYHIGNINSAIDDFKQNLQMDPHDSECMYYLSMAYKRKDDYNNAYKYAQLAQNAQYPVSNDFIRSLKDSLSKR